MSKKNQEQKNDAANVEFGIEFGDMNAHKLYEIPFMNEEKKKKEKKK